MEMKKCGLKTGCFDMLQVNKDFLHGQLIKLGDMMGDGLHHEPDGKWIPREYKKVLKALGIGPKRRSNSEATNKAMVVRLQFVKCQKCQGVLEQTRSGSKRGKCVGCGARYQLLATRKRKR
jgi:hypothetical protein